jgi:hypothetical protein
MAGICTNSIRKNGAGCDHRTVTVAFDGETIELHTGERDLDALPWTTVEKRQFILWGLKRLRAAGLSLDAAIGRVTNGEEGNNLKVYTFLGPGAAVTKTNIGTSYVNIPLGLNGERINVNFDGHTEFRILVNANLVAIGPFQIRLVRDSNSEVFYESPSLTQTGERELDSGWATIPAGFTGEVFMRIQGKSTTATDDPIFRRAQIALR